jgi:hypothetical protein
MLISIRNIKKIFSINFPYNARDKIEVADKNQILLYRRRQKPGILV